LAVDFCDGWLPGRITFPSYEARVAKIREMTTEQGKPMVMTGAVPVTSIDHSFEAATGRMNVPGLIKNANAQKFWIKPDGGAFTRIEELDGSILAGSPDDVVSGVQRYQEIGADLLIFDFRMRFPDWIQQIETLARDVLPRVSDPTTVGASRNPTHRRESLSSRRLPSSVTLGLERSSSSIAPDVVPGQARAGGED
jgi:alkanesulfonate monooxygenase SsuD/methylene tetrahydromethanopterin reductase-like flavin-dependent oxidoreductase (luciferase family)